MPLEFVCGSREHHPIVDLKYNLKTSQQEIAGIPLRLTTLANVEQSIDQVFAWLEDFGFNAERIETLAPYFGVVWPSALALAGFLAQERVAHKMKNKSMLELGCGLAIPSIIANKFGAMTTVMDSHPDVPRFLNWNITQNEPCHIKMAMTDTNFRTKDSDYQKFRESFKGSFDFIMASDVLYDPALPAYFADEIIFFANATTEVVIADPGRPYIQSFVDEMKSRGWQDRLEPWTVYFEGDSKDIYVMVFWRQ